MAADVVVLPSFIILTSVISSKKIISKSVAIIDNLLSFNCNKTFERIGNVFFFQQRLEQNLKILIRRPFLQQIAFNYCSNNKFLI